jgi:ferredoxin
MGLMRRAFAVAALLVLAAVGLQAAPPPARFPQPEFEAGYVQPLTAVPQPRSLALEYADVGVLAVALAFASWLALRRRSRGGLVAVTLFTVGYFGFFRRGCVCPIGAIQNVASVLADPAQVIPWTVAAFFILPLVFAALFGRVFCAAVCPLGALQELVLWKPQRVPAWLSAPLKMVPVIYLGLAVLLAATGADYLICRTDPFIGFYRLGGPLPMLQAGGLLLVLSMFVGRPYCRFLCPYGVLLGWVSRFAFRHATITPDGCVNCRLCEQACPYDCIRVPEPDPPPESRSKTRQRLIRTLALIPLLTLAGAGLGGFLHAPLSRAHAEVRLAERVALEASGQAAVFSVESEAFRATGRPLAELAASAGRIRRSFRIGSILLGGFIGLLLGLRWAGRALPPKLACRDMDRAECVSCARCFASCSVEQAARAAATRPAEPPESPGDAHAG